MHVGRLAGDREVAEVALLDQVVRPALLELLGLLVGHAHEVHAHAVLGGEVVQRQHHPGEPTLHVVGATPEQAVAVEAG